MRAMELSHKVQDFLAAFFEHLNPVTTEEGCDHFTFQIVLESGKRGIL